MAFAPSGSRPPIWAVTPDSRAVDHTWQSNHMYRIMTQMPKICAGRGGGATTTLRLPSPMPAPRSWRSLAGLALGSELPGEQMDSRHGLFHGVMVLENLGCLSPRAWESKPKNGGRSAGLGSSDGREIPARRERSVLAPRRRRIIAVGGALQCGTGLSRSTWDGRRRRQSRFGSPSAGETTGRRLR